MIPDERLIITSRYISTFETWSSLYSKKREIDAGPREEVLSASLAHLRKTFPDDTPRAIRDHCEVFENFLNSIEADPHPLRNSYWLKRFRYDILKSCFLWRVLYLGETQRTVPCPLHKGRWSGWSTNRCPHGCDKTCGCLTGWLPVSASEP